MDHLAPARFVLKTDVKSYYASIDHARLMNALADYVHDSRITSLLYQYLTRCAERGGLFFDHTCGISLGCALSPLIGAFFLHRLDVAMERVVLFYVRYMDDILVLARTRHKLRQAVRVVNQTLTTLGLEKALNKTFIRRVEKGFDFMGYRVSPQGLTLAAQTWTNFLAHRRRLYERAPRCLAASRRGAYVQRWLAWIRSGLRGMATVGGGERCVGSTLLADRIVLDHSLGTSR